MALLPCCQASRTRFQQISVTPPFGLRQEFGSARSLPRSLPPPPPCLVSRLSQNLQETTITYDLDRTILELGLSWPHSDEGREIELELESALAEREAALAERPYNASLLTLTLLPPERLQNHLKASQWTGPVWQRPLVWNCCLDPRMRRGKDALKLPSCECRITFTGQQVDLPKVNYLFPTRALTFH
ncbi:hypothetical protein GGQ67_003588 [Rhizobium metallidurans]|uniref:Uncharacterized protein n=1 Tax=Rhizobium metallidurans TaxID=1265931 RepID=A0A7W6CTH3_9HYPH|nr:hypothetical protein [Rhizobium metallidurans]